jgi:tetratricopeptide (TPR) repeat protein
LLAAGVLLAAAGPTQRALGDTPTLAQAPPPDAAARARQLDALFARLKATRDEGEGAQVVSEIWKLWQSSGKPELDARMEQAIRLMAHGLHQVAIGVLDDLIARAPDWAEAFNKRATVWFLIDEDTRSLADIERVLALEPRHFGALAGRGLIYMRQDKDREALAAFRQAQAINPFLPERNGPIPELEKKLGEKPI